MKETTMPSDQQAALKAELLTARAQSGVQYDIDRLMEIVNRERQAAVEEDRKRVSGDAAVAHIDCDTNLNGALSEIRGMVGEIQRLQPGGSPPPGGPTMLTAWIVRSVQVRIAALEKTLRATREYMPVKDSLIYPGDNELRDLITIIDAALAAGEPTGEKEPDHA